MAISLLQIWGIIWVRVSSPEVPPPIPTCMHSHRLLQPQNPSFSRGSESDRVRTGLCDLNFPYLLGGVGPVRVNPHAGEPKICRKWSCSTFIAPLSPPETLPGILVTQIPWCHFRVKPQPEAYFRLVFPWSISIKCQIPAEKSKTGSPHWAPQIGPGPDSLSSAAALDSNPVAFD